VEVDGVGIEEDRMAEQDQDRQVEELSESLCWDLLRRSEVGRLAVWVDDHPEIFPVNFVVDRGAIVFRTAEGTKSAGALSGGPVALEADGLEGDRVRAWSVVVKGNAEQITQTAELMDTVGLPVLPWQAGSKGLFIRVVPGEVTGRRFPVVSPESWREPLGEVPRTYEE
jgi:uncharacterized protein